MILSQYLYTLKIISGKSWRMLQVMPNECLYIKLIGLYFSLGQVFFCKTYNIYDINNRYLALFWNSAGGTVHSGQNLKKHDVSFSLSISLHSVFWSFLYNIVMISVI